MPACIQKPEGLPPISDVVLDKVRGEPIKQVRAVPLVSWLFLMNSDLRCMLSPSPFFGKDFCQEGGILGSCHITRFVE